MMDSCIQRCVKSNLFPMTEKQLTLEWAKDTYSSFHLFDNRVVSSSYSSEDELHQWISKGKSILKDIKTQGSQAGRKEVLRIACEVYNMYLPQKSSSFLSAPQKPLNIQEVVAIISDPDWYFEDTSSKQNIVHHLVYGLTRKTNNLWLIDAERKWLNSHQIEYSYPQNTRITETRGFVYKLMNSTFSNTTIKMFKRAMVSKLGEYISIRDKDQMVVKIDSGVRSDLIYEHKTFLNGKGIIIKKKNKKSINIDNDKKNENIKACIYNWIDGCIKKGMNWTQIMEDIKKTYLEEAQRRQINSTPAKSSMEMKNFHIEFDNMNNNHMKNGKSVYIIQQLLYWELTYCFVICILKIGLNIDNLKHCDGNNGK